LISMAIMENILNTLSSNFLILLEGFVIFILYIAFGTVLIPMALAIVYLTKIHNFEHDN